MILTGIIVIYYLLISRPLSLRTQALDQPLLRAWTLLEQANQESLTQDRLDLDHISRGLQHLQSRLAQPTNANQQLLSRIAIATTYQERIQQPFQLIDYQNERQSVIETLETKAQAENVQLPPGVLQSFPQHDSEKTTPQLIWAELALTKHLIHSMIAAQVESIDSLKSARQQALPHSHTMARLAPVRMETSFRCQADALSRLMTLLPSTPSEMLELVQTDYPPGKPSLFVDQILAQKSSPEEPNQVSVWLKVVGFILTPHPPSGQPTG